MRTDFVDWVYADAPTGLLAAAILGLLFAASLLGRWFKRRRHAKAEADESTEEGYILSGVLGLLALLLGFSFALAVDRFDARRLLVLEESNAVRAAWIRTATLDEPHRSRVQGLLAEYLDNRLALAGTTDRDVGARLLADTHDLQRRMWTATVAAVQPRRDDISASFMDAMSTVIEIGAARRAARQAHVPGQVFTVLLIYMIVSAGVLGYVMRPSRRAAIVVLLVLLTMSYLLIFDIDGATRGGVRESQRPMEDLKVLAQQRDAEMRAAAAAARR
jgi:hypothetical protein